MIEQKSSRPAGNGTANDQLGTRSVSIVPDADDLTQRGRALAVLVEDSSGRYRRRLYLSLRSAERAVQRAQQRGRDARAILVSLEPVEGGECL
ncbi:hypothetical protein BSP109_01638 [Brevibacterium sp. Mu109]|nr:hypothetical protein BSP109_01638 [Brevibacterium sp. Mu109]